MNSETDSYIQLTVIDEEKGMLYNCYDAFAEKFPDFICQICLSFVINPVECATCDCIFCHRCIHDYTIYSRHCPNRCPINFKPVNRILKNMINQVRVNCPFFHKGCGEVLSYENYEKHIKQCEYAPYMCVKCKYVDTLPMVVSHVKICDSKPKSRRYRCKHCGIIYGNDDDNPDNDIDEGFNEIKLFIHEYLCNEQFMVCKFCDRKFTLRDMRKHKEENRCNIAVLENKIEFLNEKIKFYERDIEKGLKPTKLFDEDKNNKKGKGKNNKYENDDYLVPSKNNNGKPNQESGNNQKKTKGVTVGGDQYTTNSNIGKLRKMEINNKTLYTKPNRISSFMLLDEEPYEKNKKRAKKLLFSYSDHNLEIDDIDMISNTTSVNKKISLDDIQKKYKTKIHYIMKIPSTGDFFIVTENSYYFLFDTNFTLIKLGKPVSSIITCSIPLPYDPNLLACGTLNSNLIILNPYTAQTIEILLHSKKEILSVIFMKNTLISSSKKENAFYLWEPPSDSNPHYVLRTTIKEHSGWVWTSEKINLYNDEYLITGSGDKSIILWKVFEQEKSVKNCLCIKGHSDSVTCVKCLCLNEYKKEYIIISGSYDGVVKINTIERLDGQNEDNKSLCVFASRSLLSIFNKDDIVKGILPYVNQENGKLVIIITCEGYEGYVINELTCLYG